MRLIIAVSLLILSFSAFAEEGIVTEGGAPVVAARGAATDAATTEAASKENTDANVSDEIASAAEAVAATTAEERAKSIENKKESEIPLTLDAPKKAEGENHPLFKILLMVSMMGAVGIGAFLFLRKHAKSNFSAGKMNQIKILTQHHLGPKKSLAIIRVAGESILIGITDQNINMIKSLALMDDEVPEATPNHFSEVFGSKQEMEMPPMDEDHDAEDEFSIRGVKDAVSKKLKGMRSFQ